MIHSRILSLLLASTLAAMLVLVLAMYYKLSAGLDMNPHSTFIYTMMFIYTTVLALTITKLKIL